MITIALVNSKGGVGKTTLASCLAVRASQEKGKPRVCMVDLDPQRSLIDWWKRRGGAPDDNPTIFEGVDSAVEAVERAELAGYDFCILDGPPAFLNTLQEMVEAADFVLIPVKISAADMLATEDAVILTRDAGVPFLVVFNDVSDRDASLGAKAREGLFNVGVPIAEQTVSHRRSYITGMNAGKSAAEVNGGKDETAVKEIETLWREVKAAATKAVKARANSTAGVAAR